MAIFLNLFLLQERIGIICRRIKSFFNSSCTQPAIQIQYRTGFLPYSTVSTQTNVTINWGGGTGASDNKPHVIYGWLVVDSTQKLVINPGVKVYFHQNAG